MNQKQNILENHESRRACAPKKYKNKHFWTWEHKTFPSTHSLRGIDPTPKKFTRSARSATKSKPHSSVSDFLLALGIEYSCVVTGASIAARYLLHALLGWRFLLLTVSSGWHSFFLEDSIGCLAFWIVLPMILASDKSCDLFLLEGWVERMMNLLRSFPSSQRPWGLFVDRSQQHRVASSQCDLPLSPSYTSDIIRRNEILAYVR